MGVKRHTVIAGDNLWNISRKELGAGAQWPRLWRYNNRRDIVRITGRGIPDPDLIYIGQTLLIPELRMQPKLRQHKSPTTDVPTTQHPTATASRPPAPHAPSGQPLRLTGPLGQELPHIKSPVSFKYRLDDIKMPPVDTPTATIEFRMTGDVLLMSQKAYPALYVTSRHEIEAQVTREMHHTFGKLVQDNRFIYDPAQKRVTVRSMLVSQSNTPDAPATAIGMEMASNSPVPKLRAEIRFPKLEGKIDGVLYIALDVKFVIEITPKAQPPRGPSAQPIRIPVPAVRPQQQSSGTDWSRVIGVGLVAGAAVVVVATIVEDFFTAGAGTADDPASFAAAGSMLARGLTLRRSSAAVLPRAAPAAISVGVSVTTSGAVIGAAPTSSDGLQRAR